jgi:acetyl-CoA carboxylase biotin carboxyl carrier protein
MAEVAAHITGTVVRIEKRPGEAVRPDASVAGLGSMKMELPAEAPVGDRLKEVRCQEGQAVSEGDVLAVIE